MYIDACIERAKVLEETGRPLDALPLLEGIEQVSKAAGKRLDAYVYRIIGRWKDSRGVEYVFRRDGTCAIAGEEAYFGGSGYDIFMGDAPYPEKTGFSVVSLKGKTLTLKNRESGKNVRLNYVGEPTPPQAEAEQEAEQEAEREETAGASADAAENTDNKTTEE